ncbi:MAG: DUF1653 domain-containing protein [Clostridiaceae bacterium]|nr:DUF1653 domain-containing protein [Clostridiaceae bacterium]
MKYKNKREVCVPGIYRHFKHTKKGEWNNYIYVTLADTKLITDKQLQNFISFHHYNYEVLFKVTETETKNELALIKINGKVYLIDCCNEIKKPVNYIVYRSLYDNKVHARPKDMFLSLLPEGRYSECNEKYRFELMMNNLKHCTGSRSSVNGKIVIKER